MARWGGMDEGEAKVGHLADPRPPAAAWPEGGAEPGARTVLYSIDDRSKVTGDRVV